MRRLYSLNTPVWLAEISTYVGSGVGTRVSIRPVGASVGGKVGFIGHSYTGGMGGQLQSQVAQS